MEKNNKPFQAMKSSDFEAVFEAIMDHSKDGLFVTNHEGTVIMVNRATERMVNFDASEIIGRNAQELVAAGYYKKSVALEVLKRKQQFSMIQITRNGKRILATGIPIFGDNGLIRFVLVNDRDITSLENLTESLEKELLEQDLHYEFSGLDIAATELQYFVIKSQVMHEVMKIAIRAAKFDLSLVLTGPTGVGKSMIARMVHRLSERRNGKFIDVNCGAISANLLESELFGYEKGAFTGASLSGKKGLFELADNGTLFLDEVGEIPLHLQVKLLRFLEEGELVRVGGLKSIKINTRVIAATNRNLEDMIENGSFRSDLFFRLNVVSLRLPPLNERIEEIDPLIDFYLERFNRVYKMNKKISEEAKHSLRTCNYQGNIRELENLVKRLVTMTEGNIINELDLPPRYRTATINETGTINKAAKGLSEVRKMELMAITEAVNNHGSQRRAAKELGISQPTISRKLKRQ